MTTPYPGVVTSNSGVRQYTTTTEYVSNPVTTSYVTNQGYTTGTQGYTTGASYGNYSGQAGYIGGPTTTTTTYVGAPTTTTYVAPTTTQTYVTGSSGYDYGGYTAGGYNAGSYTTGAYTTGAYTGSAVGVGSAQRVVAEEIPVESRI